MKEFKLYIPKHGDFEMFCDKLNESTYKQLERELGLLRQFLDAPNNTDSTIVKGRIKILSSYYGTRIPNDEQNKIAEIITSLDFDEILDNDGYNLIKKLRIVKSKRTKNGTIDHLSFATKYCHHCRPNKYPIYDSLNMRVMNIFYGYSYDIRDYEKFVVCYEMFCDEFIKDFDELKNINPELGFFIDKYIQAIGNGTIRMLI